MGGIRGGYPRLKPWLTSEICHSNPKYANEDYSIHESLSHHVQLPMPEHESLLRHCLEKGSFSWAKDAALAPPDHINHWSHEHQLLLKNPSVVSTTFEELSSICNMCTEFITIKDGVFYECGECDYILHGYCAHFPKEMSDTGIGIKLVAFQPNVYDIWSCFICKGFRNGTQMRGRYTTYPGKKRTVDVNIDSGCALLPKIITHNAHQHTSYPSHFFVTSRDNGGYTCSACNQTLYGFDMCYSCQRYDCVKYIHIECALKPLRVTHRWDPHPLHLITSAEEVMDHPHEFQCEFCSEEIDTNLWFYHCSVCDLSFHFKGCIDPFPYSKVKFGATNIMLDAHQHGLTFVLNKKKHQPCHRCHKDTFGRPVLVCIPCNFVQHSQPELCT